MGTHGSAYASAAIYQDYMGRWSETLARQFLQRVRLDAQATVLDVGSGTGSLTEQLLRQVKHVIALDPDPVLMGLARERLRDRAVTWVAGCGEDSGLAEASVDAALALLSLHNVPKPIEAVQEMRRVVKPGGLLAACEWDFFQGMEMFRAPWDSLLSVLPSAAASDTKHMPLGQVGDLTALWQQAGLAHVQAGEITVQMSFADFADFMEPTMASGNALSQFIRDLSSESRQRFQQRLFQRLGIASVDSAFTIPAKAHYVIGISRNDA